MILVLSIILGLIPLLGIVWIVMGGWLTTVDGLFMTLILLTLSGILMLNAVFEARARGLLKRRKAAVPAPTPAAKSQAQPAQASPAQKAAPAQPQATPPQKTAPAEAQTTPAQKGAPAESTPAQKTG